MGIPKRLTVSRPSALRAAGGPGCSRRPGLSGAQARVRAGRLPGRGHREIAGRWLTIPRGVHLRRSHRGPRIGRGTHRLRAEGTWRPGALARIPMALVSPSPVRRPCLEGAAAIQTFRHGAVRYHLNAPKRTVRNLRVRPLDWPPQKVFRIGPFWTALPPTLVPFPGFGLPAMVHAGSGRAQIPFV